MSQAARAGFLGLLLVSVTIHLAGCAASNTLRVKGSLERPVKRGPGPGVAGKAVAVADFAWPGLPGGEIGRDFDHARPITWSGSPGKAIPDLIATVLFEKGVPVIRVADEAGAPPDAAARISGRVDTFRVDAKRTGTFNVEDSARVGVTVSASGGNAPPQWSTSVASDYWYTDAFFVSEAGVIEALNGAANAVADEVVKRLAAAGIIAAPPATAEEGAAVPK